MKIKLGRLGCSSKRETETNRERERERGTFAVRDFLSLYQLSVPFLFFCVVPLFLILFVNKEGGAGEWATGEQKAEEKGAWRLREKIKKRDRKK